jgi:hypothetical protein
MFRRAAALVMGALVLVVASPAEIRAQAGTEPSATPRILVLPLVAAPGVSALVPGKVFEYFKAILIMNRALSVVTLDSLTEVTRMAAPSSGGSELLKEADELLAQAKELFDEGKHLAALNTFKKARTLYAKRFDLLENFDKFVDATLGVALSYFQTGYDDNGEDVLDKLVAMRPETVFDKRRVPKAALDALERLKKLNEVASPARVVLKTNVSGATVYVDGLGKPVPIHGLMRGRHVIRVVAAGYHPWADVVMVGQEDLQLQATLQPIQEASAGSVADPQELVRGFTTGTFDPAFLKQAGAVAQRFSLTAIIGSYVRKTSSNYELAVFLYDTTQGHLAELEWVKLDHDLATMQVSLLAVEEGLQQGLAVFPRTRVVSGRSAIYASIGAPAAVSEPKAPVATQPAPVRPARNGSVLAEPKKQPDGPQVATLDVGRRDDIHRLGNYDDPKSVEPPWAAKTDEEERPWAERNWWLWVVLGGLAVAGGVTAGVLATQQETTQPGFRATVTWSKGGP